MIEQTTFQKVMAVFGATSGIAAYFAKAVSILQIAGIVCGSLIAIFQFYVIVSKIYKNHTRKASNDK